MLAAIFAAAVFSSCGFVERPVTPTEEVRTGASEEETGAVETPDQTAEPGPSETGNVTEEPVKTENPESTGEQRIQANLRRRK